jgi:hypothetical protein
MATQKLTLSVDPDVIDAAKRYAAAVTSENVPSRIPPVLARLRGALRGLSIEDHREHLAEKYR